MARSALERAVALEPANPGAHLALAHVLRAARKPVEAMNTAFRAVEADPEFVEGWLFIAAIAGRLADWRRAEEACHKAVTLAPERAEGHINLGNLLLTTGRAQEAEDSYRKALALGETAEAWFGLGTALGALDRHAEAEPALTSALRLNTGSTVFREALAKCLDQLGRSTDSAAVRAGSSPG